MEDTHPLAVAALQARSIAARAPLARIAEAGDPWVVGELARVIALQDLRADDQADALALLDGLRTRGDIRPVHQGLHCQIAYATGEPALTGALLAAYPEVPAPVRIALTVDLANPYANGVGSWDFATLLPAPRVHVGDGPGTPLDRIATGPVQRTGHPLRITTIVTTWQPGQSLLTAVRSLVRQTWTNHEILVVDRGSSSEFEPLLRAAAAVDPRVRVIRMLADAGKYVARNAGLDAATGDFVTFQDVGDWSHPLRLERQAGPLLADENIFATTSNGMRVTPDLVMTRPGVPSTRSENLSSLMMRRERALASVGFFDAVRAGGDAEYSSRVRAVFGADAVSHVDGGPLALLRSSPGSSPDFRPGWVHPARRSYRSAFSAWHSARAFSGPRSARAFAVPRRLLGETGAKAYDAVIAGDWTTAGGAGAAGAGQLRALAARGLRAALLHLDVLTNLREGPQDLDPAVQVLINSGELTQVELTDDVRARLVVARSARVLQHAPDLPSGVRAQRVVIEDAVVVPQATTAAIRLFGRRPLWAPAGADGRRKLAGAEAALAKLDLPSTLDAAQWRLDRRGPRADRPVLGRHCRGGRAEWQRLRDELPDSARMDVRLLDTGGFAPRSFGRFGPPRSWLVYGPGDVTLRSFLYQIDFYLHLPADDEPADPAPDVLAALAAGCVVVLPYRYAPAFGEAAVYCTPAELPDTVGMLHANRTALREQAGKGSEFVRRHHAHELYAERVAWLASQS
ncbi:glycosyltransferase family A protein [Paractinoplanes lichenicola]|uniref:Glycosyltransferase family 2 protein n=1 Tax=Paractinoplanes lichenicola TaxID=2802976 RepID=A0ABS1W5J9_9ACTN|nr:glycosyltransferase family A protein [Actinoplanes lichenicola]MBL7262000.1 glycosyltransferase family 2 protein [Actinoplanes lichenicola]